MTLQQIKYFISVAESGSISDSSQAFVYSSIKHFQRY